MKWKVVTATHIGVVLHDFSTGGSERIAIRLCNAWMKAGRRVTIFCGTEAGALRALVAPGVTICLCTPETKRSLLSRLLLPLRIRSDIERLAPDLLFSPGNFHLLIFALLGRLRLARRPIMVCKLSNPMRNGDAPGWLGWIGEWATRRAAAPIDAFTAMSPALRAQALTLFKHHAIHHIDEPVLNDRPVEIISPPAEQLGPLVMCVGRLAPQKDFPLALAAFAAMDARFGARLVLLGEGPERDHLTAEAARLGIADRVDFKGYVADVTPHLSQASLFLMTSRFEGYPAVLIEAMAAGLPIVTTDCSPAIAEIITAPELGQIVEGRDPAKLARAIETVIAAPRADRLVREQAISRNRIGASSAAYLALFDQLVRPSPHIA
jgi:glycosyltransferase involved in cell wall biosynthesis